MFLAVYRMIHIIPDALLKHIAFFSVGLISPNEMSSEVIFNNLTFVEVNDL